MTCKVAELAVGDACTGSNPRSINPDQMAKLLKCCYYDEEVELATQTVMAAIEPMIILVLALIVGVLVAAVMAPMLTMYQAMDSL